jgi:hypothetical protein
MRVPSPMRLAALTLLVGGLACAKNNPDETVGAARDTTTTGVSDSANARQDQSGVTDSSGQSTLGKDVTKTRPDQGQPVTSKGDTINPGVDSATTQQAPSSNQSDTSMTAPSADSMSMNHGADSSSMNQGANSSTMNNGVDSATTGATSGAGFDTTSSSTTSPSTTSTSTDSSTAR